MTPGLATERDVALEAARMRIARLSALPLLDTRLAQVLTQPDVDVQYQQLRELLRLDPALAVRVLKVANSAFYGARSISSIDRALTVLGAVAVAGIAMAARFDGSIAPGCADSQRFRHLRRHSLMTAVAAKLLATRAALTPWDGEGAFVLGLLHDLGWVVHLQIEREERLQQWETGTSAAAAGPMEHALLSAALFAHWQLPPQFIEAVRDHHPVPESGPASPGSALLAVAEQCGMHGGDAFGSDRRPPDSHLPLAMFGISETDLPQLGVRCATEAALLDGLVN